VENFWDEKDKVSIKENNKLTAPFTEEEVNSAIFSYYAEEAQALTVFLSYFFKNFGS
jgi:hypothetical protein